MIEFSIVRIEYLFLIKQNISRTTQQILSHYVHTTITQKHTRISVTHSGFGTIKIRTIKATLARNKKT